MNIIYGGEPLFPAGPFGVTPSAPDLSFHAHAGHLSASWSCSGRRWEAPALAVAAFVGLATEPPESHPDEAKTSEKITFRVQAVKHILNYYWCGHVATSITGKRLTVLQFYRTHRLSRKHFIDRVVILLGQNGKFAVLLLLQPFKDSFVLWLWCRLQQMVPQCFILPSLDLASVLELLLDL